MTLEENAPCASATLSPPTEPDVEKSPNHEMQQYAEHLAANSEVDESLDTGAYLHGLRLWLVVSLISTVYFLTQVEITIVTTSLVSITNDVGGFEKAGWIMSAYLLGFVSFVVIMAKFSDILGRKPVFMFCILFFTVFSGGCAAAKTIQQLIIFRAFQGVGGGGSYAVGSIMLLQIVPANQITRLASYTGVAFILATVLGPVIGGAISQNTTWRWVFLFNVPVGAFGLALAFLGIPNGYPHHASSANKLPKVTLSTVTARVDFIGCGLLLCATLAFTSAFQEVNTKFSWNSAYFIVLIIVSVLLAVFLLMWERYLTLRQGQREPVLPWRFIVRREMLGAMLGLFLVGGGMAVTTFQLPQRFQLVNGQRPVDAGVRVLPFGLCASVGGMVIGQIFGKFKVPLVYACIIGALLQVLGYTLLGTAEASTTIPGKQYGFEMIAGFGSGISYLSLFAAVPFAAEKRDLAIGLGATHQFRAMGGAVMIAIVTSIFNGHVVPGLQRLGLTDFSNPATAHGQLTSDLGPDARAILSQGYNDQMFFLTAISVAQALPVLLMWRRKNQILPA